jgi:hypothetical protein
MSLRKVKGAKFCADLREHGFRLVELGGGCACWEWVAADGYTVRLYDAIYDNRTDRYYVGPTCPTEEDGYECDCAIVEGHARQFDIGALDDETPATYGMTFFDVLGALDWGVTPDGLGSHFSISR